MVQRRHTRRVEIQELRRRRLRDWIKANHESVVMRFAASINKPQSQVADMLDKRKSFGEKIARQIERLAKMPPLYLDTDPSAGSGAREPTLAYHGIQLTRAGALLAAEWEKLDLADRLELERQILMRVAKSVRGRRKGDKGERPTDQ